MKPAQEPTFVSLVEEALNLADDFLSMPQLVARTKLDYAHVARSLWHLSKHKAAESVAVAGDGLWWFATPSTDTRRNVVEVRIREEKPRRRRSDRLGVVVRVPTSGGIALTSDTSEGGDHD